METNVFTKFFDALFGMKKPVGKSMKEIIEVDKLLNERTPIKFFDAKILEELKKGAIEYRNMVELEKILIKNFNEGMLGVSVGKITYAQWKREYPSLFAVIIKSMGEVAR